MKNITFIILISLTLSAKANLESLKSCQGITAKPYVGRVEATGLDRSVTVIHNTDDLGFRWASSKGKDLMFELSQEGDFLAKLDGVGY